jgi:predicted glycogen debranching enzyme
MSYIQFDKLQMINLGFSLNRELLRTNRLGAYTCSTIAFCNTRKYHGLLVCSIPDFDYENHVLLSSLDETIIQYGAEFNLGIHKYPFIFEPKGHKYIRFCEFEPIPKITYRVGGVILEKEMLLEENENRLLIKYTLVDAHSPTKLRLKPFLAFRNVHSLTKANMEANTHFTKINNGIRIKLYNGFPFLYMQVSKQNEFVPFPTWNFNLEYIEEQARGYEYQEDNFVPGYFEFQIKKGEEIIFSAGLEEITPSGLKRSFNYELSKKIPRANFEECLRNAAQQFVVKRGNKTEIVAGYPWFGRWGRDTFISLPGIVIAMQKPELYEAVFDSMLMELNNGLFPNMGKSYNSVDAPLWFFWALKQYGNYTSNHEKIWKKYGKKMKEIINCYINGIDNPPIKMHDNGLIWQGANGLALTWMDAVVEGKPVTPRTGYAVEINALWHFAICYTLELAKKYNDKTFVSKFKHLPDLIKKSFLEKFWDENHKYLADCVNEYTKDWSVRPNQIFAVSLDYEIIPMDIQKAIVDKVEQELLTIRGLRTLSPKDPNYKGNYYGDQATRDRAYHQGTVWPWLMGHFTEAYLKLHKKSGIYIMDCYYNGFEPEMFNHGIGTISEIFDGDPPHKANGAISQAWSVAEIVRMKYLINQYSK